jgi:hypothetical protein
MSSLQTRGRTLLYLQSLWFHSLIRLVYVALHHQYFITEPHWSGPSLSAVSSIELVSDNRLTVGDLLDGAIIVDVDVQSLGLVVHRAHAVGLDDAVLLREVGLREGL